MKTAEGQISNTVMKVASIYILTRLILKRLYSMPCIICKHVKRKRQ